MTENNTTKTAGPDSALGRARKVIDDLDLWDALRELCDEEDAAASPPPSFSACLGSILREKRHALDDRPR